MTFNDNGDGFITCTYHGNDNTYIYSSKDQGKSWNPLTIQPLKDLSFDYINGYPPCFIGKEGFMILEYVGEQISYRIYYSPDNGETWGNNGSIDISTSSVEAISDYSFVDKNTVYIIDKNKKLLMKVIS
jgi:hypothetical protein